MLRIPVCDASFLTAVGSRVTFSLSHPSPVVVYHVISFGKK